MQYEGLIRSRVIGLLYLLAACSPSDAQMATASAQTELAIPTATVTQEPTATLTQTATRTKVPTFTPKPANTSPWDRYMPGTIAEIISNTDPELASLAEEGFYFNYGADYASNVLVTYTGQFRPISERRALLIGSWLTQIGMADSVRWFEMEGLFIEDSIEHWLPIQSALIPLMQEELTEGKPVTLFIIWIGATFFDKEIDRVFLVNEFLAKPRATPTGSSETTPVPSATMAEPAAQSGAVQVEVYANQSWQDTGVAVQVNDTVEIKYISGTWSINPPWGYVGAAGHSLSPHPPNPIPAAQPGELIGKLAGLFFRVGRQIEFFARHDGHLYLRINDDGLTDNDGALLIQITVQRP